MDLPFKRKPLDIDLSIASDVPLDQILAESNRNYEVDIDDDIEDDLNENMSQISDEPLSNDNFDIDDSNRNMSQIDSIILQNEPLPNEPLPNEPLLNDNFDDDFFENDIPPEQFSYISRLSSDEYTISSSELDEDLEKTSTKKGLESIYIIFLIFIVIGIVINLYLLYRLDIFDTDGNLVPEERRTYAAIIGIGMAIILSIIFFGGMYLVAYGSKAKTSFGSLLLVFLVAFIIIFMMGWLVGIYMGIKHLWIPDQNLTSA